MERTIDVFIENSYDQKPYKYEYSRNYDRLVIDRVITGAKAHVCNYGFVVGTFKSEQDHLDVTVISHPPIWRIPLGIIVPCRVLGVLDMDDEEGYDPKILAVPVADKDQNWQDISDVPNYMTESLKYYFTHYKEGSNSAKYVTVRDYQNKERALEIVDEYLRKNLSSM